MYDASATASTPARGAALAATTRGKPLTTQGQTPNDDGKWGAGKTDIEADSLVVQPAVAALVATDAHRRSRSTSLLTIMAPVLSSAKRGPVALLVGLHWLGVGPAASRSARA
jgi:hypothetical protein